MLHHPLCLFEFLSDLSPRFRSHSCVRLDVDGLDGHQVGHLVDHATNRRGVPMNHAVIKAVQSQRLDDPALGLRATDTTLFPGDFKLSHYDT